MTNYKKPAVDLTDLAIGLVVLGVVVSIGATILVKTRDARLTDLSVVTTSNESISPTTSGTSLANKWGKAVVLVQHNGTTTLPSGNYSVTISEVDGNMVIANTTTYASEFKWNVTYTWYNTSRADWTLADKSAIGLGEYGNWFKILVIVGIAAVVLAIIFMAFGGRQASSEIGGSY